MWPKESISDRVPPHSDPAVVGAVKPRTVKKPTPFGKYFLLERINVGGMAEVFRAKAFGVEGFERLVAVKRILPNIAEDKEFIRMFIEEAKLAVQLNHANIAQIFDLGVVDGAYYIALEHVHGRDLRGIFDRGRQVGEAMPVAQACFLVMKVCEGLDYAHNKRDQSGREISLVHRDVSPQNVLVSFEGEVKLIDFGIAKAAGKGSKTQAGILKGKFGYMSPEQVRGIPVDRRSDVFSCGIVLYELLTGERLFVGESDFSTLEKVRNVEILPPSTYNRKIPDELERIVLKALAKDVEDRYQNAIDLHDELQAFVYTAGEFYSRKDLAGWMKKTFGKEIEDETAKLESYRQLKPPVEAPAVPRTTTGPRGTGPAQSPPPRRSTQAMAAVGTKPPPPPSGRISQQLPAVTAPAPVKAAKPQRTGAPGEELAWDDDELETQIYDNPEDDPKNRAAGQKPGKPLPLSAPAATGEHAAPPMARVTAPMASAAVAAAAAPPSPSPTGPDLSSLVSTSKGWQSGTQAPSPSSTLNGMGATGPRPLAPPANLAIGSNKAPAPQRSGAAVAPARYEPSPNDISSTFRPMDPSEPFARATFGSGVASQSNNKRGIMLLALGGAAVAAIAVVVVIAMSGGKKDAAKTAQPSEKPASQQPVKDPTPTVLGDQNTGFDLYVTPQGVTQWKLDGEARTDRLPSRIRGIAPGPHTVQVDPPAGFMSQNQQVNVETGKAPKVEITLSPIQGIQGTFESTPPGATVSLIIDGKRSTLGPAPIKAPLDPRMTYQVLFERPGYVSVNRPITFTGALQEKVVVNLEKAGGAVAELPTHTGTGPVTSPKQEPKTEPKVVKPEPKVIVKTEPKDGVKTEPKDVVKTEPKDVVKTEPKDVVKAEPKGTGVLTLGSKPPCDIYVDGSSTGLHTPQREIKLAAGKHRITLMNNEFGIKETFVVEIKPDATEKMIKDYSDRLPK